jgi:predicted RNA binding protein YcfA (HicA-like mRNA interferase family)
MKYVKIREFRKKLGKIGCSLDRVSGSHEIWVLPNGRKVSLVQGRGEVSRNVMQGIKLVFKESGYADPFDD